MLMMIKDFRTRHLAALTWLGIALAVAVLLSVLVRFLGFAAVLIVFPIMIALAVAGLAALTIELRGAFRETQSLTAALMRAGTAVAIIATGVFLFLPCLWVTSSAITWVTLAYNYSTYSRIVVESERGIIEPDANTQYRSRYGTTFVLDTGPPIRVAFPLEGGFLDNWEGIVYDPTDAVSQAKGFTQASEFTAPDNIKSLFGGDIVACSPMIAHYYHCTFT